MIYYPSKEDFIKIASKGANLIPVYREILADFDTPISAFTKVDTGEYSFLLESVEGGQRLGRYSFLGSQPNLVFSSKGNRVKLREGRVMKTFNVEDPTEELKKIMSVYKFANVDGLPRFCGGLVGFMGYDMIRFIERIPDENPDDIDVPDSVFMLTDTLLIFDHVDHKIKVVSNVHITGSPSKAYEEALRKIDEIIARLKGAGFKEPRPMPIKHGVGKLKVKSNFTRNAFQNIVRKAKEYIRRGDIIQVVLSQRLKCAIRSQPLQIYRALRSINPSPYMYYLKFKGFSLVGSSPEIMVRCEDGVVEVRPIAGTRPRGKSEEEDKRLARDLLKDPKERAEHIMLVDLGRNDIGRVCNYESVKVSDFMTIEKYSHVMHIVTDVKGRLKKGKDVFDVIRAAFPAGTVTGAPKVRAMEIIDELENVKRTTYAGCVGYFSFSGNLDCCITIRTILIKDKIAYIQAGAGLVADSVPKKEYQETLNKARALVKAIEMSERGLE